MSSLCSLHSSLMFWAHHVPFLLPSTQPSGAEVLELTTTICKVGMLYFHRGSVRDLPVHYSPAQVSSDEDHLPDFQMEDRGVGKMQVEKKNGERKQLGKGR